MSAIAFCDNPWGSRSSFSNGLPHPWLSRLKGLTGDDAPSRLTNYLVAAPLKEIARLAQLPEDWDGYGSAAPLSSSVSRATLELSSICEMAIAAGNWNPPHISLSEEGEVTFEWWSGPRKLTLYFGANGMQLLRSWGPNLLSEMTLDVIHDVSDLAPSWAWLNGS